MSLAAQKIAEINDLLSFLTDEEKAEVDEILKAELPVWVPLPGPQTTAFESLADVIYYGGSAGGGKSDLLLGLALTAHSSSIIFRRESVQLEGLQQRMLDEILHSRQGWNGQKDILTLPNRRIEFGSCKDPGNETKYQGRPHDLVCVERGTPVRMDDGSYRSIELIARGDSVATLEGPCKVTKTMHQGAKDSVRVTAIRGGATIGSQVQSLAHSLLTTEGWVSHDNVCAPRPFLTSLPTLSLISCIYATLSSLSCVPSLLSREALRADLGLLREQFLYLSGYRSLSAMPSGVGPTALGNDSAAFERLPSGAGRHSLSSDHRGLSQRHRALSLPGKPIPSFVHGTAYARLTSLLRGYLGSCLSSLRHDGGPSPLAGAAALLYPQRQDGAAERSPRDFEGGVQEEIPIHSHYTQEYIHPYTKETRRTPEGMLISSLSYSPVGKRDLFDITVETANHYITGPAGFVNKNCFDEIPHFMESQFRFLIGWNRTTKPGQRCRVVCAGNPPTNEEGRWVINYWGPWLQPNHPKPALPGELRFYVRFEGENSDTEVEGPEIIVTNGKKNIPRSRTFIPSFIGDNPFLMDTGYEAVLQSFPEPLRSQMLMGDFRAGTQDSAWQVLPTAWVEAAMERWKPDGAQGRAMDSVGADIARGGQDKTCACCRHGNWYSPVRTWPGKETPDGATAAGMILSVTRDKAPIHVDGIGVGGSVVDHLRENNIHVVPIIGSERPPELDGEFDKGTGKLQFVNMRSWMYWRFRESLDPKTGDNIALPPDNEMKADLCAPHWKLTARGIQIESKDDSLDARGNVIPGLCRRLGRSPDKGDTVIYASRITPKIFLTGQNFRGKVRHGSWRSI